MNAEQMIWALLLMPLASAVLIQLVFPRSGKVAAAIGTLSTLGMLGIVLATMGGAAANPVTSSLDWANIAPDLTLKLGFNYDAMASRMMLVVTGIGLLVHVFSIGYMKGEQALARYFAGLSIFLFAMTGIVLSDNLIMTFIYWELVGFASYLLIGHWYTKEKAADAAKKAFITNRIGDFGFLLGILTLFAMTGTTNFLDAGFQLGAPGDFSQSIMNFMLLCLFCGAVGKSAQFPLHVWLPDAMEGPTPVSALIHAATMVAAGVYMMVRVQVSFGTDLFPEMTQYIIAGVGLITSVLAGLMAIRQDDIKRVLAYSTLSQLGLMIVAVGMLAGGAAMFHLYTHAWFKALLFLGAGAVIFSCHHEQDMWKMGGLARKMKLTTIFFLMGTAALIAIPGTSGFFSKEMIIASAHNCPPVYYACFGVAGLTAFYMTRMVVVTFFGKTRSHASDHAHEVSPVMWVPLAILAVMAILSGYPFIANHLVPFISDGKPFEAHAFHFNTELLISVGVVGAGVALALLIYWGKQKDPLAKNPVGKLFANKFYFDEIYTGLVRTAQDLPAAIVDFVDQFIIHGLIVGGAGRLMAGFGVIFRRLQSGNLNAYALLFGVAAILIIYLMVLQTTF